MYLANNRCSKIHCEFTRVLYGVYPSSIAVGPSCAVIPHPHREADMHMLYRDCKCCCTKFLHI